MRERGEKRTQNADTEAFCAGAAPAELSILARYRRTPSAKVKTTTKQSEREREGEKGARARERRG